MPAEKRRSVAGFGVCTSSRSEPALTGQLLQMKRQPAELKTAGSRSGYFLTRGSRVNVLASLLTAASLGSLSVRSAPDISGAFFAFMASC